MNYNNHESLPQTIVAIVASASALSSEYQSEVARAGRAERLA
jgi:hypothetical protein